MNNNPDAVDNRLDSLLRDWSQAQTTDAATLERLQRAIIHDITVDRPYPVPGSIHPRAIVAVCALATCLLLAVLAGFHGSVSVTERGPIARHFASDHHAKLAAVWAETGRLFGSDLEWICDLDGELLLGVNNARKPLIPGNNVCLSLMVRVFDPAQKRWVTSWTGCIECPGGTTVDFASADRQTTGSIWVQSRPDGRFVVSHWLNWRNHSELSGPIDTTVPDDEPQVVAEAISDGRRIQVVQQVWRPDVG